MNKHSREKLSSYMDDETNAVVVINKLLPLFPNAHLQHQRKQEISGLLAGRETI